MKKIYLFLLLLPFLSFSQEISLIDFGASTNTTSGNWNNVTSTALATAVSLKNTSGTAIGATLTIDDTFGGTNTVGTKNPYSLLPFPSSATSDSFYDSNGSTAGFTLSGLDPAKLYSFQVFASRTSADVTDNRAALYTITGLASQGPLTATLDAALNSVNSITIYNVMPTAAGTIKFKAEKASVNTNSSGFFYLGAIQLTSNAVPALTLGYPNGGELWEVGKTPNITWSSTLISGNVTLEYSIDNGSNWTTIATPDATLGKYAWTVPNNVSTQCLVRISSGALTSQSPASFSIIPNVSTVYRIAVLGSSTAAAYGFSGHVSDAWVWLYSDYLSQHDTRYVVDNLAESGTNTYNILPTGSSVGTTGQTIKTYMNITKALSNGAKGIIVNMPTNDSANSYPVADQIANYQLIKSTAGSSIPTRICSVQPRLMTGTTQQDLLTAMVTALPAAFPDYLDFWTGFANGNNIVEAYNQGDNTHMNAAAHQILFQRVLANGLHLQVKSNVDAALENPVVDFNFTDGNPSAYGANPVGAMVTTPPATTYFNNLDDGITTAVALKENSLGASTPFTLTIDSVFAGASGDLGTSSATGSAAIFPDQATYSYWYGQTKTGGANDPLISPSEGFTINNLDNSKYYTFTIFAARADISVGTRTTQYTATGATTGIGVLSVLNNTSNVAIIKDIQPSGGAIHIAMEAAATSTDAQKYYYINAMRMAGSTTPDSATTTWNGSNWSNDVPTAIKDAIFTGDYASPSDAAIDLLNMKSLTVNSGNVVINSLDNIIVQDAVNINSGTLTLKNNANLYQAGTSTNTGDITVERNSNPLYRLDYTMWSTPVTKASGQTLTSFSENTASTRFYTYDPTNNYYVSVDPTVTNFSTGNGYLIRMPNSISSSSTYNAGTAVATFTGSFIGTPNNGNITLSGLTANSYNAIGNPYPSTIEADKFILANPGIGALYFWRKKNDSSKSSYASYTLAGGTANTGGDPTNLIVPSGIIQVGQGFITRPTGTSLQFTNAMRKVGNENQTLKMASVEKNRIWLNLSEKTTADSTPINQMMIAYMTNATLGVDDAIDGLYFNDYQTALTSLINNEEYVIQGRPVPFDVTDVVPLAFKTTVASEFTINVDHVDGLFSGNQEIILTDKTTGIETNLKTSSYSFSANAGVDNARFTLKYQKTLGVSTSELEENNVVVYKTNENIYIKSSDFTIDNVKILDVNGRMLFEKKKVNASEIAIDKTKFGNQVLLVAITSNENLKVIKKVLN